MKEVSSNGIDIKFKLREITKAQGEYKEEIREGGLNN